MVERILLGLKWPAAWGVVVQIFSQITGITSLIPWMILNDDDVSRFVWFIVRLAGDGWGEAGIWLSGGGGTWYDMIGQGNTFLVVGIYADKLQSIIAGCCGSDASRRCWWAEEEQEVADGWDIHLFPQECILKRPSSLKSIFGSDLECYVALSIIWDIEFGVREMGLALEWSISLSWTGLSSSLNVNKRCLGLDL